MDKLSSKILTIDQVCEYTGYAKSYVYQLTSAGLIPFSKPNGKKIFFDKDLLDNWILGNNKKLDNSVKEAATCHG